MTKIFDFGNYGSVITESPDTAYRVKLPIAIDKASPVLSKKSLDFHYNILHQNYVKQSLAGLGGNFSKAGAHLHNLFFEQFQPPVEANIPHGKMHKLVRDKFAGWAGFKRLFKEKAQTLQGAGWCYLTHSGTIKLIENHSMVNDVAVIIDMWEHSYYLDYGTDKTKYLDEIWKIINWDIVNARLNQ